MTLTLPTRFPIDRLPAFGLRPVSYLDRLTLKSWDTLDKTQVSIAHVQMANDVYDDSIHYLDRQLGVLLDELRGAGCSTIRWSSSPRITASISAITACSSTVAACTGNWSASRW